MIEFKNQENSAKEFNRKHSTVIHSIKTVQKDYQTNKEYRKLFGLFLESNKNIITHKFRLYESKQVTDCC